MTWNYIPSESCFYQSGSTTQNNIGISDQETLTYKHSPLWFTLNDGAWIKAWPSISSISPLLNDSWIAKNQIIDPATGVGNCVPISAELDLVFNVYDSVKDKYIEVPLKISVP